MSAAAGPAAPQESDVGTKFKELNAHPLFMTNLPDDSESNAPLEALQSLIYDDTPDNTASGFKEQGNDYFKKQKFTDARKFYTQAIDAKPEDQTLLESLYLNRAACNLKLQNYGLTLRDCAAAIKLNPKSSKAYFRSATALLSLDRLDEARDACLHCLAFDQNNVDMSNLQKIIDDKIERKRLAAEKKEREAKEAKEERALLELSCAARQLSFSATPGGMEPLGFPSFDPSEPKPYSPTTTILFPVLLLYPQHSKSDFISHFNENSAFADQLAAIFPASGPPADWDRIAHEYKAPKLAVYVTTRTGRLLKVGRKMTLADVFLRAGVVVDGKGKNAGKQIQDGLEIKDGCLRFQVVPKGKVEDWYVGEFKKERALSGEPMSP